MATLSATNLEDHVRGLLSGLEEDISREGLKKTPQRVVESLRELTAGYRVDVDELLKGALFHVEYREMVLVKDIRFASLCEHHMLPFFGKVTVAYIPKSHILGLSKIPRLVQVFARRLQVQERMTEQIARTLSEKIDALGVGVIVEARHLCMEIRGAKCQGSPTVTSAMLGAFRKDPRTRDEFLTLAKK